MFRPMHLTLAALALPLLSTAGLADLTVRFIEGAPKDRVEIKNVGACALTASTLTLDLTTSQGALIFDVTGSGAGIEIFQPFEVVAGREALTTLPTLVDGQNSIDLPISTLGSGASIAFTIDVDDTLGGREITVTGSEISGAKVKLVGADVPQSAFFGSDAQAKVTGLSC